MVVYNRNFYVYGGYDDYGYKCNDMYEYRPTANKWCRVQTQGEAPERYHHSAVAFSGSMYLFGGNAGDPASASALFEYRFGTNTWTRIPTQNKAPEPRWGHSCFIHEQHLYIIGGCDNILCFKDVHRISLSTLCWKKVKKLSGFDPRYFGGCVVLKSDNPVCTYDPAIHEIPLPDIQCDDTDSSTPNTTVTNTVLGGQGVTVIHHSTAVVAAAPAPAAPAVPARATAAAITVTANFNVNRVATPPTALVPSSSGSQLATSASSTPPLPAVTPTSPLPTSEHLGLGVKILYHGGRNIHNWAFGDMIVLSLESESEYNPYETQMKSLVDSQIHFGDVTFLFPNEPEKPPIYAHKSILSVRCEPFYKMFSLQMAESTIGKIDVLDTDYDLFKSFLAFIYTGNLPPMDTLQEYMGLLYLADKYFMAYVSYPFRTPLFASHMFFEAFLTIFVLDIQPKSSYLKGQCEKRLKPFISSFTLPLLWETAQATHASSLQRSCVHFVARFSEVLLTPAGKKSLPKSLIIEAKAKLSQTLSNSST